MTAKKNHKNLDGSDATVELVVAVNVHMVGAEEVMVVIAEDHDHNRAVTIMPDNLAMTKVADAMEDQEALEAPHVASSAEISVDVVDHHAEEEDHLVVIINIFH